MSSRFYARTLRRATETYKGVYAEVETHAAPKQAHGTSHPRELRNR